MSSSGSTPSFTPSRTPPVDLAEPFTSSSAVQRPNADGSDGELEAFRREWRNEVLRRHQDYGEALDNHVGSRGAAEEHSDAHEDGESHPHSPSRTRHLIALAEEQEKSAALNATVPSISRGSRPAPQQKVHHDASANGSSGTRSQMKAAVKAYATAVENERRGNLDDALVHYRKAFRLDASADRLYERAYTLLRQSEHEAASSRSQRVSTQKQRDALLASAEVVDMVRRATDFDDVRMEAIEKMQAQAARSHQRGGSRSTARRSVSIERHREEAASEPTGESISASLSSPDDDLLDKIVRSAEISAREEGREPAYFTFQSPPPALTTDSGSEARDKRMSQDSDELVHRLQRATLEAETLERPPPLIAKLPDEILAHICRCVIEPRGVRNAKIRQPRQEPVVAVVPGKGSHFKDGKNVQQQQKLESSTAAVPTKTARPDGPQSHHKQSAGVGVILAGPDWQSLEMLGRASWKWRIVSRRAAIWRFVCQETYQDPQLALPAPLPALSHPRLTFIHHPRLRLTGCYIAACHYSRPGLSVDNAWVRVIHLVEFYRSIRFLPDGRALTLLTTDQPKDTVGKMHASNAEQGFAVGRWRVESHPVENPSESEGGQATSALRRGDRGGAQVIIEDLRDRTRQKYSFQMILSLRSTSRGKWNKMEMLDYRSVNLETGEVCSIPAKHSRPFHFSTVRSYGV